MIITDVAPLDNKRRRVYIDGEYAFPLYLSEIRKFHIEPECEITDNTLDVINEVIHRRIRERILYLISSMPRTENNIRTKLLCSHYTEEYINPVIDELKQYNYIDDMEYAINYAESLRDNRGKSRRMIEQALYSKGISQEIIRSVMQDFECNNTELIWKALRKKGYSKENISNIDIDTQQRLFRYLCGKGFIVADICNVFRMDYE